MRAIQTRFRPVSRGRAGAMLSKFSDVEICRGGVRTNRGPWAGGPRRAGRRDGSVARGGCGFISTHRTTRRVEFCRIPRGVRGMVGWNGGASRGAYPDPVALWIGSIQVSIPSEKRRAWRGARALRAMPLSGPFLVPWSPVLSDDRSIETDSLYVYLEHPASHGYRSNASSSLRPIVAATAASATAAVSHPGAT